MTEAAKPLAVEDVLTSIRRLLAQDRPAEAGPADDAPMSIEHTLAALEAAMAGRRAPPEPAVPEVVPEALAPAPVEDVVTPDFAPEPVVEDEAPFISVDMTDAEAEPSFSFRHKAEIRRLQLVSAPDDGFEPAAEAVALEAFPEPEPEIEEDLAEEAVAVEDPVLELVPPPAVAPVPDLPPAPPPHRLPIEDGPRSLFDESDESPIDKELLRRLVGEILREELQGALGERMTRNVKKLVRAEIRRALAED